MGVAAIFGGHAQRASYCTSGFAAIIRCNLQKLLLLHVCDPIIKMCE